MKMIIRTIPTNANKFENKSIIISAIIIGTIIIQLLN